MDKKINNLIQDSYENNLISINSGRDNNGDGINYLILKNIKNTLTTSNVRQIKLNFKNQNQNQTTDSTTTTTQKQKILIFGNDNNSKIIFIQDYIFELKKNNQILNSNNNRSDAIINKSTTCFLNSIELWNLLTVSNNGGTSIDTHYKFIKSNNNNNVFYINFFLIGFPDIECFKKTQYRYDVFKIENEKFLNFLDLVVSDIKLKERIREIYDSIKLLLSLEFNQEKGKEFDQIKKLLYLSDQDFENLNSMFLNCYDKLNFENLISNLSCEIYYYLILFINTILNNNFLEILSSDNGNRNNDITEIEFLDINSISNHYDNVNTNCLTFLLKSNIEKRVFTKFFNLFQFKFDFMEPIDFDLNTITNNGFISNNLNLNILSDPIKCPTLILNNQELIINEFFKISSINEFKSIIFLDCYKYQSNDEKIDYTIKMLDHLQMRQFFEQTQVSNQQQEQQQTPELPQTQQTQQGSNFSIFNIFGTKKKDSSTSLNKRNKMIDLSNFIQTLNNQNNNESQIENNNEISLNKSLESNNQSSLSSVSNNNNNYDLPPPYSEIDPNYSNHNIQIINNVEKSNIQMKQLKQQYKVEQQQKQHIEIEMDNFQNEEEHEEEEQYQEQQSIDQIIPIENEYQDCKDQDYGDQDDYYHYNDNENSIEMKQIGFDDFDKQHDDFVKSMIEKPNEEKFNQLFKDNQLLHEIDITVLREIYRYRKAPDIIPIDIINSFLVQFGKIILIQSHQPSLIPILKCLKIISKYNQFEESQQQQQLLSNIFENLPTHKFSSSKVKKSNNDNPSNIRIGLILNSNVIKLISNFLLLLYPLSFDYPEILETFKEIGMVQINFINSLLLNLKSNYKVISNLFESIKVSLYLLPSFKFFIPLANIIVSIHTPNSSNYNFKLVQKFKELKIDEHLLDNLLSDLNSFQKNFQILHIIVWLAKFDISYFKSIIYYLEAINSQNEFLEYFKFIIKKSKLKRNDLQDLIKKLNLNNQLSKESLVNQYLEKQDHFDFNLIKDVNYNTDSLYNPDDNLNNHYDGHNNNNSNDQTNYFNNFNNFNYNNYYDFSESNWFNYNDHGDNNYYHCDFNDFVNSHEMDKNDYYYEDDDGGENITQF